MILVTTPTGDIGSRVLDRVLDSGRDVRVVVRDSAKLPDAVRARVDVVEGSHSDPDVIRAALDGVTSVFWLPPGSPVATDAHEGYVEFSEGFCRALPDSSVTHVIGVSSLGRDWDGPAGLVTASLAMDDAVAATGVAYRALACVSLMGNVLRQADVIRETGMFYGPADGDVEEPHVAKADVAAVAAGLLLSTDWEGVQSVPLCGPESLSFNRMAEIMSDVLGREVRFQGIPMDAFAESLRGFGTTPGMVEDYVKMMTAINYGMYRDGCAGDRSRTPTTFRQWCERELRPAMAG